MNFLIHDRRLILYIFFKILVYTGFIFLMPGILVLLLQDFHSAFVFLALGFLTSSVSYVLQRKLKTEKEVQLRHAFVIISLFWIIVPLISAVPFIVLSDISPVDAAFECMSAWTTTGFSVIKDVEAISEVLLLFRSLMQWVGGVGIAIIVLGGIFKIGGERLYFAEARDERIKPNIINTVKVILLIYLFYTILGIALFLIAGMPFFDSVNHTMTAISTGGMSVKSLSIGAYNSAAIELTAIFIMLLGAISFSFHYNLIKGNIQEVLKEPQIKMLFLILFIAFFLLPAVSIKSIFTVVSALTCTGFGVINISIQPEAFKFILIFLMLIGGSAGSTAGGIKLIRFGILIKSIFWHIRKIMYPNVVFPIKIGKIILNDESIKKVFIFTVTYLMFFFAGSMIITTLGYPISDAMFEAASAQANVGLSSGIVSPELHLLGKATIFINMLVGRLELWAVIILFMSIFVKK